MNTRRALAVLVALLSEPSAALGQAAPSAYTSAQRYDAVGRVTGTIAPDPDGPGPLHQAAVRNSYDFAGLLTKVETGELAAWQSEAIVPLDWANFTIYRTAETQYDAMGRKARDTLSDGTGGRRRQIWLRKKSFVICVFRCSSRSQRSGLLLLTSGRTRDAGDAVLEFRDAISQLGFTAGADKPGCVRGAAGERLHAERARRRRAWQDQFNLYAYAGDDSVNQTHPGNLSACDGCWRQVSSDRYRPILQRERAKEH